MRPFSVLRAPVVVAPMPLPALEQRLLRTSLVGRAPRPQTMALLRLPAVVRLVLRIARKVIYAAPLLRRLVDEVMPRGSVVVAVVGARPPPLGASG